MLALIMKKLIIANIILLSTYSFAGEFCNPEDKTKCCDIVQSKHNTHISRLLTYDQSACTMSVRSGQTNVSFRRFGFASDGQFSIFIQPGGNSQRNNSTQSFLIYPFGENPTLNLSSGNQIQVDSGSGQTWIFNSQNALPTSIENCDLSVSSNFNLNESGINIDNCKNHLVIKTPLEVGGESIAYPNLSLTVEDPSGVSCQIKTNDLYNYLEKGTEFKDRKGRYYNIQFKFKTNRDLGLALKQKCPTLDVSMLLGTATPSNSFREAFGDFERQDEDSGNSNNKSNRNEQDSDE